MWSDEFFTFLFAIIKASSHYRGIIRVGGHRSVRRSCLQCWQLHLHVLSSALLIAQFEKFWNTRRFIRFSSIQAVVNSVWLHPQRSVQHSPNTLRVSLTRSTVHYVVWTICDGASGSDAFYAKWGKYDVVYEISLPHHRNFNNSGHSSTELNFDCCMYSGSAGCSNKTKYLTTVTYRCLKRHQHCWTCCMWKDWFSVCAVLLCYSNSVSEWVSCGVTQCDSHRAGKLTVQLKEKQDFLSQWADTCPHQSQRSLNPTASNLRSALWPHPDRNRNDSNWTHQTAHKLH